jgi:hypothetical protein
MAAAAVGLETETAVAASVVKGLPVVEATEVAVPVTEARESQEA